VSEGSGFDSITGFISTPTKIRSRYRRRLLNRLSEGGETVSSLAREIGLQIPHASAELRRLRNEGLVSSDLTAGSRGAYLYLTDLGWDRIRSDERSRAIEALPLPSETDKFCILDKDGSNILIGLSSIPKSPMILIPDRPPQLDVINHDSIGNEGVRWNWAIFKERNPRWFDLQSMTAAPPPSLSNDPEKIETYSSQRSVIGIIRASLLDEKNPIAMTIGTWFDLPKVRQNPPLNENTFHRGEWTLGECHELSQEIRPNIPLIAILADSLSKTMLLRTARINSLIIANLGGLNLESDNYPLAALEFWIMKAHPRLPKSELKKRVQSLSDRIMSTRKVRTDDSTWRKFRRDWGNTVFTTDEESIRKLDIRGLGKYAVESLVSWVISKEERPPLVLELDDDISSEIQSSAIIHPKLRVLIKDSHSPSTNSLNLIYPDYLRPLPWLRLQTSSGKIIPFKLVNNIPNNLPINDSLISEEINPWKIVGLSDSPEYKSEELEAGYLSMVYSAISQFPNGNEEWANQMEARYPIAAWVASPKHTRWPRWQRLKDRISVEWLVLFDIDHIPLEKLAELADESNEKILDYFAEKLEKKIREERETIIRTRPAVDSIDASSGTAWVAAQFLANAAWIPEYLHDDLTEWSLQAWLAHPPKNSLNALKGVSWLYSNERGQNNDFPEVINRILLKGQNLSNDHDLKIWSSLVSYTIDNKELGNEEINLIIERLPYDWWAHLSSEILLRLLNDDSLTEWLLTNPKPWVALVLRPSGELGNAPGLGNFSHPGFNPEIHSLLIRKLRGRREREGLPESADSLVDLLDAIESSIHNVPPNPGRTHLLSGWLAQPLHKWPDISPEVAFSGNAEIGERLLSKKTGFSENMTSINL
jgi:DNA-binding transcriptional ArsR family regulator